MPDSAVKSQQLDASELRAVESLDARRSVRFVGRRSWGVGWRDCPYVTKKNHARWAPYQL